MWIWTFQTFRKLMWSWWSYFQKAVSKEESSICKVVGNAGRAFSFHKREAASSEKKNTGLVQTSWESHLVRCHLLRFQWIFIFRSPDGVQIQSGFGPFFLFFFLGEPERILLTDTERGRAPGSCQEGTRESHSTSIFKGCYLIQLQLRSLNKTLQMAHPNASLICSLPEPTVLIPYRRKPGWADHEGYKTDSQFSGMPHLERWNLMLSPWVWDGFSNLLLTNRIWCKWWFVPSKMRR